MWLLWLPQLASKASTCRSTDAVCAATSPSSTSAAGTWPVRKATPPCTVAMEKRLGLGEGMRMMAGAVVGAVDRARVAGRRRAARMVEEAGCVRVEDHVVRGEQGACLTRRVYAL